MRHDVRTIRGVAERKRCATLCGGIDMGVRLPDPPAPPPAPSRSMLPPEPRVEVPSPAVYAPDRRPEIQIARLDEVQSRPRPMPFPMAVLDVPGAAEFFPDHAFRVQPSLSDIIVMKSPAPTPPLRGWPATPLLGGHAPLDPAAPEERERERERDSPNALPHDRSVAVGAVVTFVLALSCLVAFFALSDDAPSAEARPSIASPGPPRAAAAAPAAPALTSSPLGRTVAPAATGAPRGRALAPDVTGAPVSAPPPGPSAGGPGLLPQSKPRVE